MQKIEHSSILVYLAKKKEKINPPKYLKTDDSKRIQVKQNFEKLFKAYDLDYNDLDSKLLKKNHQSNLVEGRKNNLKFKTNIQSSNFEIKCLKSNSSSNVISINLSLEASFEQL